MRALTLTQPWATLVAHGCKVVETRSWGTSYRGPLAIHAAKGFPPDARALCVLEPFADALRTWEGLGGLALLSPQKALPLGALLAVCVLVDVVPTSGAPFDPLPGYSITDDELAFGNYAPGRYGWILRDVERLPEPVPCRGALGLWTPPARLFE